MTIPIENIYYLLCYAWDSLEQKDRVRVDIDDRTDLLDLFAKILINSTKILLKRGIDRNYVVSSWEYPGIKGKLELSTTVKTSIHLKQKTICSFDEFSPNILTNQILVTTLFRLLRTRNLDREHQYSIRNLIPMFGDVRRIELRPTTFRKVRLHRNNHFYSFVLHVCQLIAENLLPSEVSGEWEFTDFARDENKMNKLFERFIFNFYRLETALRVRREDIQWKAECSAEHAAFLPLMRTDITLEAPNRKVIMDAKYYRETLAENYSPKIHSGNLYQVFSYLVNQEDPGVERTLTAAGIMVYPTTSREYDLHYRFGTHLISVRTLNLNTNWKKIADRLKSILEPVTITGTDQLREDQLILEV